MKKFFSFIYDEEENCVTLQLESPSLNGSTSWASVWDEAILADWSLKLTTWKWNTVIAIRLRYVNSSRADVILYNLLFCIILTFGPEPCDKINLLT